MLNLQGLIAAPYTPLKPDGNLNIDFIEKYYNHLKSSMVNGVFINGSTADFTSLTIEERNILIREWCKVGDKGFIKIAHVGHTSLKECQSMAEYCGNCGADVIATLPPFYFRPDSIDILIDFCADVAQVNPHLPFLYYHIPQLTGVYFTMVEFLEKGKNRIPNLVGVKFTEPDLMDFKLAVDYDFNKFRILFGVDEIMLSSLALGATGWIGSTYNHAAPLYHDVIKFFKEGKIDEAGIIQHKIMDFIKIVSGYGWAGASKHAMKLIGIDCGPVRAPHRNLTDQEKQALELELNNIGFFDLIESKQFV